MILVDFSQIVFSNLMVELTRSKTKELPDGFENLLRHMVLNSLRSYRTKFSDRYGELVICCDNKNYWRKKSFPYYKANRRKAQSKSDFDWVRIFEAFNLIKGEIKHYFPYKVLEVETAEADDIIGTLAKYEHLNEPIMIISGDHDFSQLQKYKNVYQYNPVQKKHIKIKEPEAFLKEHILKGDIGDGIPNYLSADATFVTDGMRQKSLGKKKIEDLMVLTIDDICNTAELKSYWIRNENLIDLNKVPEDIQQKIRESFYEESIGNKQRILNYFIKYRLRELTTRIQDF